MHCCTYKSRQKNLAHFHEWSWKVNNFVEIILIRDEELCLCSRIRLLIFFSVRLNKKYIGQFSYRVGYPVRCPPFIAQFCVTYCTNRALLSHSIVTGYSYICDVETPIVNYLKLGIVTYKRLVLSIPLVRARHICHNGGSVYVCECVRLSVRPDMLVQNVTLSLIGSNSYN
jgi:hypothetical protein